MYINIRKYIQVQEKTEPYNQHRLNILLPIAGTMRTEKIRKNSNDYIPLSSRLSSWICTRTLYPIIVENRQVLHTHRALMENIGNSLILM